MVHTRHFHEEGGDDDDVGFGIQGQKPKRRYTLKNVVKDAMREHRWAEFLSGYESLVARVVREEMEHALISFQSSQRILDGFGCRGLFNEAETSGGREALQLHFGNSLPSTIFTGTKLQASDGNALQILLLDASSQIIRSGPLSSAKLEVLVLKGEFGSNGEENWSEEEFCANVLSQRQGKRPLITGILTVCLLNGVGEIADVRFTDNSSWIRSGKFRLGAKIGRPLCSDVRVKEARSQPFKVKDQRGEVYKKNYPPRLEDAIWRLEKIAKEGKFHTRLAAHGVNTVKDFLRLYHLNPSYLHKMFGRIPAKTWATIEEHANTCVIHDHSFFMYPNREIGASLWMNCVFKVIGGSFNGLYIHIEDLNPYQKNLVEDLKQKAYENLSDLVPVDEQVGLPLLPSPNQDNIQFQF